MGLVGGPSARTPKMRVRIDSRYTDLTHSMTLEDHLWAWSLEGSKDE